MIPGVQTLYGKEEFLYRMAMNGVANIDWCSAIVSLTTQFTPGFEQKHTTNRIVHQDGWFVINFRLYQYVQASQQVLEIRSHEAADEVPLTHSSMLYTDQAGKHWIGTSGYGVLTINSVNENFYRVNGSSVHWLHRGVSDNVIIKKAIVFYLLKKK